MHFVDLGESFPTHVYLQNLASVQPRTSPFKFARSPRTDPPGLSKETAQVDVTAGKEEAKHKLKRSITQKGTPKDKLAGTLSTIVTPKSLVRANSRKTTITSPYAPKSPLPPADAVRFGADSVHSQVDQA